MRSVLGLFLAHFRGWSARLGGEEGDLSTAGNDGGETGCGGRRYRGSNLDRLLRANDGLDLHRSGVSFFQVNRDLRHEYFGWRWVFS